MCILGAVPFGAMGFIRYNGMTAEQLAAAFIKSELLMPKHLCFEGENLYWLVLKERVEGSVLSAPAEKKKSRRKGEKKHD